MNQKIEKILEIWHEHFEDEDLQYGEFESSDIEYFVGCLLYNHFSFSKALDTMKTIDLSYDFIESCSDEYDEIIDIIQSIKLEDEIEKLKFLQNYIRESKEKYLSDELYLLNRLDYHVSGMAKRYLFGEESEKIDFKRAVSREVNPLLR